MPPTDRATELSLLNKNDDGRRFFTTAIGELPGLAPAEPRAGAPFLATREHRRFTEFADAVRQHRYIGLCWGPPGVGKTLSARNYAGLPSWEQWQRDLDATEPPASPGPVPPRVLQARTAVWTPTVTASPREVAQALPRACQPISYAVDYAQHGHVDPFVHNDSRASGLTELLIIDEADRLKTVGLEQVRDYYDRHTMGVILIGMPGIEKRLARYPQLYSRVGFAHEYRTLTTEELTAVLTRRWHADGLAGNDDDFTESVAIATIARITGGNFRLVDRLLSQIQRIQRINHLGTVTPEVVEAAREALLIGH